MGVTTTYGWRAPNLSDPANGPAGILTALQDTENTVKDTTILSYVPSWSSNGDSQPGGASTRIGYYRVDHGICHVAIYLVGGGSVSGGTGDLSLSVPLPANPTIARQSLSVYTNFLVAGGGVYTGFAHVTNSTGTMLYVYLPASASDVRHGRWRNAPNGNTPGAGVPLVPGNWAMYPGSEVTVCGSYFL